MATKTSILKLKKYNQEGDLAHEYNALHNILNSDGEIVDFRTSEIQVNLNNPVSIECQPSYDGTVNLIINDDNHPPRIINSRFTTIEDNRYRVINRNQLQQTNLYVEKKVDPQTRLFRNVNKIPQLALANVFSYGQLMGGNYTFYIKFADNDANKTDVVCESSIVSIFKGSYINLTSISGALYNERTDKAVKLSINNVDTSFSKIYIYYVRESSALNGSPFSEVKMLTTAIPITGQNMALEVNGFEDTIDTTVEELNITYNLVTAAKTQAQVQNMLFFGNTQGVVLNNVDLQNISLYIQASIKQSADSIGYVGEDYSLQKTDGSAQAEYYSPINTYYKLGYWPGEMYRYGIVYQMMDDSLSPVYNLRGHKFTGVGDVNFDENSAYSDMYADSPDRTSMTYIPQDIFIEDGQYLDNVKGVFSMPDNVDVINHTSKTVNPMYLEVSLSTDVLSALKSYGVKGYFIVRQKRIPITLCQGMSVGVDRIGYIPMIYNSSKKEYIAESFLASSSRALTSDFASRLTTSINTQGAGIISVEVNLDPSLQSMLDGSKFVFQKTHTAETGSSFRMFWLKNYKKPSSSNLISSTNAIYVNEDVPIRGTKGSYFSTRAGSSEAVKEFSYIDNRNTEKDATNLIRGIYTPFVGLSSTVEPNCIYNIKVGSYSTSLELEYFKIRSKDNSAFYAASDRYEIPKTVSTEKVLEVYRGDCYTNTVSVRMSRNFTDSTSPTTDSILSPNCWKDNYKGRYATTDEDWGNMNRADVNNVPMGMWITYKCLSSFNLGLRSEDKSNVDEIALMGNARGFYPLSPASTAPSYKISESFVYNTGYAPTVGRRRNFVAANVPYAKDIFDTRIMFSNVQVDDDFKNAYRIFQGLSYKDIDRQYGAIVKLLPWGVNLLCVFEHGVAILPINEKALMSTASGQSIHMYGAGVLQNQVSLINPDYGSVWKDSIIKTQLGVYGVDTYAKKIWRYSDKSGFELLSDVKIQRFLNDNIVLAEKDKYPTIALKNVKTLYNAYKGDVMFTFYNDDESALWHLCYNERLGKWITRYSWIPLFSENVNNIYYSLDKKRAEVLAYIYDNQNTEVGINIGTGQNEWANYNNNHTMNISVKGYDFYTGFDFKVNSIRSSYMDGDDEIKIDLPTTACAINSSKRYIDSSLVAASTANFYNRLVVNGKKTYFVLPHTSTAYGYILNASDITGDLHYMDDNGNYIAIPIGDVGSAVATIDNDILTTFNSDNTLERLYYIILNISVTPTIDAENTKGSTFKQNVGVVMNRSNLTATEKTEYDTILTNGFYVHGRAGVFDEIDYFDNDITNQIRPTRWYDKQEPFEIEFIVNTPVGAHKIFNNLVIISNNVAPESLEFSIIGDVYNFNKAGIYKQKNFPEDNNLGDQEWKASINPSQESQEFENAEVTYDHVLNQYNLLVNQPAYDMTTSGRLLGNMRYTEDSWLIEIEPISYKRKEKKDGIIIVDEDATEVRLRDKFITIRVKYSGEDIAVITALRTLMTLSFN